MQIRDGRKLTLEQKELLRKQAVNLVLYQKMSRVRTAKILGVCDYSVRKWVKSYNESGLSSLDNKTHGRPVSGSRKLKPWQCANIVRIITDNNPQQLKFPFALWTINSVIELVRVKFNIKLSSSNYE